MRTTLSIFVSVLLFAVLLANCGKPITDQGDSITETTAKELSDDGWARYEAGDFIGALSKFEQAKKIDPNYSDSYNGIGWTEFALYNVNRSVDGFRSALTLDSMIVDANVGNSIAQFENNEYLLSLNSIKRAIKSDSTQFDLSGIPGIAEYAFTHKTSITSREVRYFMALNYYYLGQFSQCYQVLTEFLLPQLVLDKESPKFVENLYKELEKLQ